MDTNIEYHEQQIKETNKIINSIEREIKDNEELINFIKIFNATVAALGIIVLTGSIYLVNIYWHSVTFYVVFYAYLIGAIPLSIASLILGTKSNKKIKKLKKELLKTNETKEIHTKELERIKNLFDILSNIKDNKKITSEIYTSSIERINQTFSNSEKTKSLIKKKTL